MRSEGRKRKRKRRPLTTPQVRRSLQGQFTPHLSNGARKGGIERDGGVTHLSPGEVAVRGMSNELKREWGTVEKHTCPLTCEEMR